MRTKPKNPSRPAHQRLLVLHQPDDLHRLLLQLVLQVVWQRRQHGVKVLLSHRVVHGQDGLTGGERGGVRAAE